MRGSTRILTFIVIKKYPGLTLDELAEKIGQEYANAKAAPLLSNKLYEHDFLKISIKDLNCVEEKDGRYYFNSKIKPYSTDTFVNGYIENRVQSERKSN